MTSTATKWGRLSARRPGLHSSSVGQACGPAGPNSKAVKAIRRDASPPHPRSPRTSGFTLLEVLVATVIMGIAVTGLIVGLSQSVHNAARLSDYDRAVMLARTKLNDLLLDPMLPLEATAEGQFDAHTGWKATARPFDAPPNAGPGALILQEIALEIWWQPDSGSRRSMQLSGYRQFRIPSPTT
ncbi:MAG: type II secretion system protein [Acidobacteriota bacterium]|nr:type II secretion system protein [Acidobacteriota bacterium]